MAIHLAQITWASQESTFGDLLVYLLTGLIIVLMVLSSLWIAVTILGRLFKFLDLKDPVSEAATSEISVAQASPSIEVTPELMAVIGAALHTVIKGPFKIVSVEESEKQPKS